MPVISFRQRSLELENIDKGSYAPEEYEGCLAELRRINRWMGDARALRRSVLKKIGRDAPESFTLLDVGAGSGELLRTAARWARSNGMHGRFVGLERDARAARSIIEESREFVEIRPVRGDALRMPFADAAFDYVICSLFTHHFTDEGAAAVLREMDRVARRRVFVIDLHRHPVAYYFYVTAGRLLLRNRLTREDGALSILRGFIPGEMEELAHDAGLSGASLERRFPYRLVLSWDKGTRA